MSVLYTLDGSKPETVKRPGSGGSTMKFTEPIRLPVGKVSVRAVAVSKYVHVVYYLTGCFFNYRHYYVQGLIYEQNSFCYILYIALKAFIMPN